MSTDYSALTDDELNRLIAERRGLATDVTTYFADGQLWTPIGHGYVKHSACPSWSTDLNAAAELLKDMAEATLAYDKYAPQPWDMEHWLGGASAATPSRAVCIAWLVWTDEQPTPAMLAARASAGDEEHGIDGLD